MIIRSKKKLISTKRWKGGSEIKRWHISELVFLVVATALLLAGSVAALTPCDAADNLFKLQLYEAAQTNYTDLLKNDPTLTCAQNGSLEVQRAEAIRAYEKGRAYENASQVTEASKAYVMALEKYPNYGDAQKALARLNGGILTLAYTLYTFLRPALEFIVVIAIFIIVILLVALIAKNKIFPWIIGSIWPSLDIGNFDKGTTALEIDKEFGAIVQEKYMMLGHEGSMRVNMVEGAPDKFQIPTGVDVVPYFKFFKFLSEMIDWLFPPYVITLSGYLHKPGSLGSGITVALVVNQTKKILDSYTIWQNELDLETKPKKAEESIDPTSYYNLAEPVAIWVYFQLGRLSKKDKFKIMGTNDWKSYVYFQSGVRRYKEGKIDKAQQLYLESLDSGMKNWGTLLNLGRMEMEEGQYQHAYERLKMATEKTISDDAEKSEKSMDFPKNRIWYLATYSLALTYCYLNKRYESNLTKAKKEIETLIETINKSIDARHKNDKMVQECNFSMFEEEAKTLFKFIQKAIDDLQIAEKISQSTGGEKTDDLINRIKKSVDTIRGSLKARLRNEENVDLSNEIEELKKAINELPTNNSEPFVFIMSQAEEEAKNLVYAIKKAIGLPMTEQEAKKLADMIQEAIDTQQKNEDKYTSKAKEQADKLVKTIKKAIMPRQKSDDKKLKESLELFCPMASIMYADTLLYVNFDKNFDEASSIIQCIKPYSLTYRGRYNLACYYSILGEKAEEKKMEDVKRNAYRDSLCHLEFALERGGGIVEWANKDPDFNGVRGDKDTKEDFAKLIQKYAHKEKPYSSDLSLAGIAIIKEAYAKQLKEQGIVSHCDLILKADTPQAMEVLAKKLGISTQLLHRWVHLADLMRIVGDTKYVNLLEAADYGSIEALNKVSDPCELANLLNQVNKAQSLVKQLPPLETVQQWVQEAKKTKAEVL